MEAFRWCHRQIFWIQKNRILNQVSPFDFLEIGSAVNTNLVGVQKIGRVGIDNIGRGFHKNIQTVFGGKASRFQILFLDRPASVHRHSVFGIQALAQLDARNVDVLFAAIIYL